MEEGYLESVTCFRYTKLKNSEWFANQVGLVDAVC